MPNPATTPVFAPPLPVLSPRWQQCSNVFGPIKKSQYLHLAKTIAPYQRRGTTVPVVMPSDDRYPSTYLAGEKGGKPQRRESPPPEGSVLLSCIGTDMGKPSGLSTNEEGSRETGLFLHQLLVKEGVGSMTLGPQVNPLPIPLHP